MPKRRIKHLAIKVRKKSKVKSVKKRARSRRKEDKRASIGEALGVSPMRDRDREANLAEDHAMTSAIAAARRVNTVRKTVQTYTPSRRSSFALM